MQSLRRTGIAGNAAVQSEAWRGFGLAAGEAAPGTARSQRRFCDRVAAAHDAQREVRGAHPAAAGRAAAAGAAGADTAHPLQSLPCKLPCFSFLAGRKLPPLQLPCNCQGCSNMCHVTKPCGAKRFPSPIRRLLGSCQQEFMEGAGEQGVLLVATGTVATLGGRSARRFPGAF